MPGIHSTIVEGQPKTIRITVVKRGEEVRRRSGRRRRLGEWLMRQAGHDGCSYAAQVTAESYGPTDFKVCGFPADAWTNMRPGQTFGLEGFRTQYGFRFVRATY